MNAAVAKYKYFFVSGVHKSGTSWLAHLLRAHPAVAMPRHELWLFGHKQSIAGAGLDRLFENWLRLHCVAREAEETPLKGLKAGLRRRVVSGILEQYVDAKTRAIGSKTPRYYAIAYEEINEAFPDSVFIEIVRDPRDVIVSHHFHRLRTRNFEHYSSPTDAEAAYAFHIQGQGAAVPLLHPELSRKFAKEWVEITTVCRKASELFGPRFISVRYEQLLSDPKPYLQQMFGALGVKTSRRRLHRIVAAKSFAALSGGRSPGESDPKNFYRKGVHGDWVNHFDDEALEMVESIAGEQMVSLGYAKGRPVARARDADPSRGASTGLFGRVGLARWLRAGLVVKANEHGPVSRW